MNRLLYIVMELAEGGSVALDVGVAVAVTVGFIGLGSTFRTRKEIQ